MDSEEFDVIVIGGGPAGSSTATFTAMTGHRVLLLEKCVTPIYKIGESLLPATVQGICAMLGVTEELKKAKFVLKRGGTFRWGREERPWTFEFSQSHKLGHESYAYQVERMKFDSILLKNARRNSVDVREGHAVLDLIFDGNRVGGVKFLDTDGRSKQAHGKYVVDASGHLTATARHIGQRIYSQFFRNIAIFGYFLGGKRLPPPNSGNIFCVAFSRGWFWYIPLSENLTSVGAVIGQENGDCLRKNHEAAFIELIAECEAIRNLLAGATRASEKPYDEIRVRKDYSYCHSKFWSPGLVLVGDAACFVDPVFSSGVHLATYSGLLAARAINTCLRGTIGEERAFAEFDRRYRREYKYFYDFLVAFYDVNQDLDSYYWTARKVLNSEENANEAFIQLVAGIGRSGEPLYETAEKFRQARMGIGQLLFPHAAGLSPDAVTQDHIDRRNDFMLDLVSEISQLHRQATGTAPRNPKPLFDDGLIPSPDGLHWTEPLN